MQWPDDPPRHLDLGQLPLALDGIVFVAEARLPSRLRHDVQAPAVGDGGIGVSGPRQPRLVGGDAGIDRQRATQRGALAVIGLLEPDRAGHPHHAVIR
jgi:hypothetical protein